MCTAVACAEVKCCRPRQGKILRSYCTQLGEPKDCSSEGAIVKQACDTCTLLWFFFHIFLRRPFDHDHALRRSSNRRRRRRARARAGRPSLFQDSRFARLDSLDSTHSTDTSERGKPREESKAVDAMAQRSNPNPTTQPAAQRRATPSILLYSTQHHRKQKCSGIFTAAGTPGLDAPRSPAR